MRKKWVRIGIALLVIALRFLGPKIQFDAAVVNSAAGKIVVIDPGHGGIDPGALSKSGLLEKNLVLEIAKKLETKLNSYAIYTVLTRQTDTDLAPEVKGPLIRRKREDLNRRAQLAQEHNADLLISIHANSFPESKWSGAQTFYPVENGPSRFLAEAIQSNLVRDLGPNSRKAKPGDFRILRESMVPSVMVEVGFLSNPREAELLSDAAYQERLATAIANGIVEFFEQQETSQVTAVPSAPLQFVGPDLKENEVLLFFASLENTGLLDCEKRTLNIQSPDQVLSLLQQNPQTSNQLRTILNEDVEITYIGQNEETAYVTLTFGSTSLTGHTEELAVYSIVNTLTLLPDIDKVVVEVVNGSEEFDWSKPLKFNAYLVEEQLRVDGSY